MRVQNPDWVEPAIVPLATLMSHASPNSSAFPTGGIALYRASQPWKGFSKSRRRATDDSLERAIEVRHRLKAAGESGLANSRIGIEQERLRFLYTNSGEIIDEMHPGRFLKHLAKVMPADVSRVSYAPE